MKILSYFILFFSSCVQKQEATCIRVIDGDTFVASNSSGIFKVRLAYIDAPELAQPYGQEAKEDLQIVIQDQKVTIHQIDIDSYGRTVALVYNSPILESVNELLVKNGLAWCYKGLSTDQFYKEQQEARIARFGLWKDDHPIPPFKFRQSR